MDYDLLVMNPARALAMTVIDLLADGATQAQRVLADFKPRFTKDEYLQFVNALAATEHYAPADD